jgi:hypothetical protein
VLRRTRLVECALLVSMALPAGEVSANGVPLSISRVAVGHDGHYKVGRWTPISVTVQGGDPRALSLVVTVIDPDGNLSRQPTEPRELKGPGPHELSSLFLAGRMDGTIRVALEDEAGVVTVSQTLRVDTAASEAEAGSGALRPPDPMDVGYWLTLGASEGFVQAAEAVAARDAVSRKGTRRPVIALPATGAGLSANAGGLDAIDLIAACGPVDLPESTSEAIRQWVSDGGHLVVSLGRADDYTRSALAAWLPVRVTGQSRLRDLTGMLSLLPGAAPLRFNQVEALAIEADGGMTLASSLDGPIIVRMPYGFGRVTLAGVDISAPPFVSWSSLPALCEQLAEYRRPVGRDRRPVTAAQLTQTGVSDLATQLALAMDQYPEVRKLSNWSVMGLIALYLLVIGPLDYLLVHRLLRRPHWTWVTLPLFVLLAAGLSVASARQLHPESLVANQMDLLDLDVASGGVRRRSWMSFVSPQTQRHHVRARGLALPAFDSQAGESIAAGAAGRLRWLGMPEVGFRGMYRRGGLELTRSEYDFVAGFQGVADLPVELWSSSSLEWSSTVTLADAIPFESRLQSQLGQLDGEIVNRLSVPIDDWFLAHENRVYLPGIRDPGAARTSIAPGESVSVLDARRVAPRILRSYLTGLVRSTVIREGERYGNSVANRETYDPLSTDLWRILREITFYEASGGEEFATIANASLGRQDLSPLLRLDRAVLFGRIAAPQTEFVVNDQPVTPQRHDTVIRIVLPVASD